MMKLVNVYLLPTYLSLLDELVGEGFLLAEPKCEVCFEAFFVFEPLLG